MTVTECLDLFHRLPRMCFVYCSYSPVLLYSFVTYYYISNDNNTVGVTSAVGISYLPGAPRFNPVFSRVSVTVFSVLFCHHGFSFIMPLYYFHLRFWLPVSYLQAFRKLKCQSILLIILTYKLASSFLISWKVNWRYLATMSTYDILLGFIIRAVPIFVNVVFH